MEVYDVSHDPQSPTDAADFSVQPSAEAAHTAGPDLSVDDALERLVVYTAMADGQLAYNCERVLKEAIAAQPVPAPAPELYEANREAADFIRSYFGPVASDDPAGWSDQDAREVYAKLRTALARAEGRSV